MPRKPPKTLQKRNGKRRKKRLTKMLVLRRVFVFPLVVLALIGQDGNLALRFWGER